MGNMSSTDFVKRLFSSSDADGDGSLSADELSAMVANGPEGGPSVDDLMSKLDTDGNGSLTESEFRCRCPSHKAAMSARSGSGAKADEVFDALDTNKDGNVSQAEWEAAVGGETTLAGSTDFEQKLFDTCSRTSQARRPRHRAAIAARKLTLRPRRFHNSCPWYGVYMRFDQNSFSQLGVESLFGSGLYA